jgi:hypothetical protein
MEREGGNSGRFCGSFCNVGWIAPQDLARHFQIRKRPAVGYCTLGQLCSQGFSHSIRLRMCSNPPTHRALMRGRPRLPPSRGRYARGAACDKGKHEGAIFSLIIASITLSRTSWVPLQAESLGSQALYLVTKRFNFLSESRFLGFPRIGAAQFFQRFLNGEFGCFSHGRPSYPSDKRSDNCVTRQSKSGPAGCSNKVAWTV